MIKRFTQDRTIFFLDLDVFCNLIPRASSLSMLKDFFLIPTPREALGTRLPVLLAGFRNNPASKNLFQVCSKDIRTTLNDGVPTSLLLSLNKSFLNIAIFVIIMCHVATFYYYQKIITSHIILLLSSDNNKM